MTIISHAPRTIYSLTALNHKLLSVAYHAWAYACQLMVQTAIEYEIIEILLRLNSKFDFAA
jgi:DNA-binding HxlR family transcriptional regulator